MKSIYEPNEIVYQLLGKQKIDTSKKYRKFFYLTECSVEGGCVILNTITYELIFLSNEEIATLNNADLNVDTIRYLVEAYFLVPEEFDDKKFATQLIDTRIKVQNIYKNCPLQSYVILTTTGCNARCFYCFEKGAKISNMTEQTAHDVADFIERKSEKKISIQWFGGEPLVNIKAIDTICNDLIEKNVKFDSTMVSNAYLLDENAIKKALELWNLKRIQITLDGTEEIYNKTKNYVYNDVKSPFKIVLKNIENALKAGIEIRIRLNLGEHNSEDLYELSKFLVAKFNKYKNCRIYVVRLFEDPCDEGIRIDDEIRHKLISDYIELQNYIDSNMPKLIVSKLSKSFEAPNMCMANSDSTVMILPDGHLGKCEHYVDREFIGSIYSDELDLKKIAEFKEHKIICDDCLDCELRSLCMPLKCCNGKPNRCDHFDKISVKARLDSKLKNIYNKYIEIAE